MLKVGYRYVSVVRPFTIAAVLMGSACSGQANLAEWTIPVPSGTGIIELAVRPLGERGSPPVELREDLVLGGDTGDPSDMFYGVPTVAVGMDGSMFVLDPGNNRVSVFDASGQRARIFGRHGQGPEEFSLGTSQSLAITKDRLRVDDRRNRRLSIWSADGEFIETHPAPIGPLRVHFFEGLPDGNRIAFATERLPRGSEQEVIAVLDDDGEIVWRYGNRERNRGLVSKRHNYTMSVLGPSLRFETSRDGHIYLYDGAEYQILALRPSREVNWALRVAYQANPYPEEYKRKVVELRREDPRVSDLRVSDFAWPERWPALLGVYVDGHGHVYVVPLTYPIYRDDLYPVDVFSSEGELLYSGTIATTGGLWSAALGDYVYQTRQQESGDHVIVRYRLVEPF